MSPAPVPQAPQGVPLPSLDDQLRAWFEFLVAQPVPEALLRHLDQLAGEAGG